MSPLVYICSLFCLLLFKDSLCHNRTFITHRLKKIKVSRWEQRFHLVLISYFSVIFRGKQHCEALLNGCDGKGFWCRAQCQLPDFLFKPTYCKLVTYSKLHNISWTHLNTWKEKFSFWWGIVCLHFRLFINFFKNMLSAYIVRNWGFSTFMYAGLVQFHTFMSGSCRLHHSLIFWTASSSTVAAAGFMFGFIARQRWEWGKDQ